MPRKSDSSPSQATTYRDAGVDIDAGATLIERIKPAVRKTFRPEVLGGLGGFGALFELPLERYRHPVLVSGADGVGTKLKLAQQLGRHRGVGIDLVAMCVNDVIVQGAEPLFFLDYFATGKLDVETAAVVIEGIAAGCEQAGCALIGGETAEMPGMYAGDDYDLAGFCVGVVEKNRLLDGSQIQAGDAIIGIASSGLHSNGFSLARKIIEQRALDLDQAFESTHGATLGDALLAPTQIYVQALLPLLQTKDSAVRGLAHVTGGGLLDNVPRVLPAGVKAQLDTTAWPRPAIFDLLQDQGNRGKLDEQEMLRTFNCGIGMVVVTAKADADSILRALSRSDLDAWVIGETTASDGAPYVEYVS